MSEEEEEEEDDSRDAGGTWQVLSSRSTGKRVNRNLKVPSGREWSSEYRGRRKPIDEVEESNAGDIDAINPAENGTWEALKITVDSGAVDTVGPKSIAPGFPTQGTEASKRGMYYRAANDTKIAIRGKQDISGYTSEGSAIGLEIQIADVKKALGSVRKMCEVGNRVVFDEEGSYDENKRTGERTELVKE